VVTKSLLFGILLTGIVLIVGCQQKKAEEITIEEAYKLIEDTFKKNISENQAFPINESLRLCNNVNDCSLVRTDWCKQRFGYINKRYEKKWKNELDNWRRVNTNPNFCFEFACQIRTTSPECINHLCVWEKIPLGC